MNEWRSTVLRELTTADVPLGKEDMSCCDAANQALIEHLAGIAKYDNGSIIIEDAKIKLINGTIEFVLINDVINLYYKNNVLHREDGYAIEFDNYQIKDHSKHYINGKYLTEQEFNEWKLNNDI